MVTEEMRQSGGGGRVKCVWWVGRVVTGNKIAVNNPTMAKKKTHKYPN